VTRAARTSAWRGPLSLGPRGPAMSMAGLLLDTDAGVEQVLEKDVLDVLRADAARAQRGEAGLHQEDQRTCAARGRSVRQHHPMCPLRWRESGGARAAGTRAPAHIR
jgi:hypothetical protein